MTSHAPTPASTTVIAGQTASFTVSVNNGAIPTVQWQSSSDGGTTWSNVSGATAAALSFATTAGQNGNEYRAALTTSAGRCVASAERVGSTVGTAATTVTPAS